jgi:fatty-acyl-CoA synthase
VFEAGDTWFRTGDLMRRDRRGYYYFVDRSGDTFRWKGENVSTSEVEQVICSFPGVRQACVYGVTIPDVDGKAGMAAVSTDPEFPLGQFYAHLCQNLPDFAHPVFLRLCREIETTATFRNLKERLVRDGYDPGAAEDAVFFQDRQKRAFVPLDSTLFQRIQTGGVIV